MTTRALKTLGLERGASLDEAKAAFKRLALKFHPDKNSAPDAGEKFKVISAAFRTVADAHGAGEEADELPPTTGAAGEKSGGA